MSHLYIGTKAVRAEPMTQAQYNDFRGWALPADADGAAAGYLVEYLDGGKANVSSHAGYVSWSPADVFAKAYKQSGEWSFGLAVEALECGKKVARAGWNGKGMFLFLVRGSTFQVNRPPLLGIYPEGTTINYHSHIAMKAVDGEVVPWVASQTDVLAKDWCLVD